MPSYNGVKNVVRFLCSKQLAFPGIQIRGVVVDIVSLSESQVVTVSPQSCSVILKIESANNSYGWNAFRILSPWSVTEIKTNKINDSVRDFVQIDATVDKRLCQELLCLFFVFSVIRGNTNPR